MLIDMGCNAGQWQWQEWGSGREALAASKRARQARVEARVGMGMVIVETRYRYGNRFPPSLLPSFLYSFRSYLKETRSEVKKRELIFMHAGYLPSYLP